VGADRAARRRALTRASSPRRAEGVHHVAGGTPKLHELLAAEAHKGSELVLSGTFGGYRVAYLATAPDLRVIAEIFGGRPDSEPGPTQASPDEVAPGGGARARGRRAALRSAWAHAFAPRGPSAESGQVVDGVVGTEARADEIERVDSVAVDCAEQVLFDEFRNVARLLDAEPVEDMLAIGDRVAP
jgi:hypothetical protein